MAAFTIFLTLLVLLLIMGGGVWGGFQIHQRLNFLEEEYRRLRLASVEDSQQFEKQIAALNERIEALESRSADSTLRPINSVNYTQRSQMLRMVRRGDSAEQIAHTLGVPVSQVRLLMKLPGLTVPKDPVLKEKFHAAGQPS